MNPEPRELTSFRSWVLEELPRRRRNRRSMPWVRRVRTAASSASTVLSSVCVIRGSCASTFPRRHDSRGPWTSATSGRHWPGSPPGAQQMGEGRGGGVRLFPQQGEEDGSADSEHPPLPYFTNEKTEASSAMRISSKVAHWEAESGFKPSSLCYCAE